MLLFTIFIIVVTQKLVFQRSKNVTAKCTETLSPPPSIQYLLGTLDTVFSRYVCISFTITLKRRYQVSVLLFKLIYDIIFLASSVIIFVQAMIWLKWKITIKFILKTFLILFSGDLLFYSIRYSNIWIFEYLNIWIFEYLNSWIVEYLNFWIYE